MYHSDAKFQTLITTKGHAVKRPHQNPKKALTYTT